MANVKLQNMIDKFSILTDKPVKYLTVQNDIKKDVKNLVKSLYDFTKSQEQGTKSDQNQALNKIIVNDFDEEQIWQQIDIQNNQCWDQLVWDVANSISSKNDLMFPIQFPEDHSQVEEGSEKLSDGENVQLAPSTIEKTKLKSKNKVNKRHLNSKKSVVDDQFFKLQDMEKFLINEEKMEVKGKKAKDDDDDGSVDMFDDVDSEASENDGGKEMMYSDFFNDGYDENDDENGDENMDSDNEELEEDEEDTSGKKRVRFAEPNSEDIENSKPKHKKPKFGQSDSEESNSGAEEDIVSKGNTDNHLDEKKSDFELRQQRLKERISKLEEKTLKEAPWQLKGEIDATKRPQNSLLEEVLDFDLTTRPPPIITEQTTVTLEGLIKQRIKDKAWDDVIRKEKPVDDQLLFKKPEVLDQSKSKLSLAQVYETEYLKQKQASSGEVEEEKEPESHTEVRTAMKKLFSMLDALCHYHYTPKAPQAEVKIVSNTPAISMEEVAPVAASDAALLAPEEIKRKRKGELMSKEERTQTDRNRERRKKKKLQRQKGQVMKVTEHRNTKKGVETNDKSLKTSKAFFQQLNDESSSLIKSKKNVKK